MVEEKKRISEDKSRALETEAKGALEKMTKAPIPKRTVYDYYEPVHDYRGMFFLNGRFTIGKPVGEAKIGVTEDGLFYVSRNYQFIGKYETILHLDFDRYDKEYREEEGIARINDTSDFCQSHEDWMKENPPHCIDFIVEKPGIKTQLTLPGKDKKWDDELEWCSKFSRFKRKS